MTVIKISRNGLNKNRNDEILKNFPSVLNHHLELK